MGRLIQDLGGDLPPMRPIKFKEMQKKRQEERGEDQQGGESRDEKELASGSFSSIK